MIDFTNKKIHIILHLLVHTILFLIIYLFDFFPSVSLIYLIPIIMLSNLIDIDHLLSKEIYKEGRCSLNSHIFHRWYFITIWIIGLFIPNNFVRIFCLGAILHIAVDGLDCYLMKRNRGK